MLIQWISPYSIAFAQHCSICAKKNSTCDCSIYAKPEENTFTITAVARRQRTTLAAIGGVAPLPGEEKYASRRRGGHRSTALRRRLRGPSPAVRISYLSESAAVGSGACWANCYVPRAEGRMQVARGSRAAGFSDAVRYLS